MRIISTSIFLCIAAFLFAQSSAHRPLEITRLTGDFYIFTTFNTYQNSLVPANGLYLVTTAGVLMIDTPWDTTQFQPLLDSIENRHHRRVTMCIATHSHEDRTGGLEYYRSKGIRTYTTRQTDEICIKDHQKRAEFLLENDTTFQLGNHKFQTYFPGPGHTPDNIVVWFPKEKILYGGCLVKSMEATDLGNLASADVRAWPATMQNLIHKFKRPRFVIPGHQSWNDVHALQHTEQMASEYIRNSRK